MNTTGQNGSTAAKLSANLCRAFFRACRLFPLKKRCALLSRQPGHAGDLQAVGKAIGERFDGYSVVEARPNPGQRASTGLLLRQIRLAATSELVITDGYIPAVCICVGLHRAKCVQLWHSLGAIKAFGYLALGTEAGHSEEEARVLHMHEGYDLIVAGLTGAVPTLAKAFNYPQESVVPLGLPRIDRIFDRRELVNNQARLAQEPAIICQLAQLRQQGSKVVLYAPTFRQKEDQGTIKNRTQALVQALPQNCQLVLARHPLDASEVAPHGIKDLGDVSTLDALCCVDVVVTDYSAIAFEAWLAGCRVLFWTPDIEEYRKSPGLVIDPLKEFPDVASQEAQSIGKMLNTEISGGKSSFDKFMTIYAEGVSSGATARIVKAAQELMNH